MDRIDRFKNFFITDWWRSKNDLLNHFFEMVQEPGCYPLWIPPVDIYETAEGFIVEAEVPGVNEEDIDIKVEDNVLFLRGMRKTFREGFRRCYRLEREEGYFSRRFILSSEIDTENIRASLKDGVLIVIIPKKEEYITRHIRVEGE